MGAGSTLLVSGVVIAGAYYFLSKPPNKVKSRPPGPTKKLACMKVTKGEMERYTSTKRTAAMKPGSRIAMHGGKVAIGRNADGSYYYCS